MAAGVLYPIAGVLLDPMIAAAAMSFSSVSIIANTQSRYRNRNRQARFHDTRASGAVRRDHEPYCLPLDIRDRQEMLGFLGPLDEGG